MLKLFSVKDKQKKDEAAAAGGLKPLKMSAGELRIQKGIGTTKLFCMLILFGYSIFLTQTGLMSIWCERLDMAELNLPPNITIAFPDGKTSYMHFTISIRPDEGMYRWVGLRLWVG